MALPTLADYADYVVPIFDDVFICGQGCFFGDYLLTSGHVIGDSPKAFFYKGESFLLNPSDAVAIQMISKERGDEQQKDYAIFKFQGINSPLSLSTSFPNIGDTLDCISFLPDDDLSNADGIKRFCCRGRVVQRLFDFFSCRMEFVLSEGSSGSPLISGNTVWGILTGLGDDSEKDVLLFQSTCGLM